MGELEILMGCSVSEKEKYSRMEVPKSLAYSLDNLGAKQAAALYGNFIRKIEKGKFK